MEFNKNDSRIFEIPFILYAVKLHCAMSILRSNCYLRTSSFPAAILHQPNTPIPFSQADMQPSQYLSNSTFNLTSAFVSCGYAFPFLQHLIHRLPLPT